MSVLIKGMEMPENCFECPLNTDYVMCGYYEMCDKTAKTLESDYDRRPDACPLVEVSTPHGDLIERKEICLTDFEIAMCDGDYKDGMKMLLEKIESAPTIIPADEADMDSFIRIFEEDDEEDGMDSFIRIFKD